MSLVLRHKPESIGLELDRSGWADIAGLLEKSNAYGRKIDLATLMVVVEHNDKQRFELNDKKTQIRAVHGHSIDVDLLSSPTRPPDTLYHGTATRSIGSIKRLGINQGKRRYVHLSDDPELAKGVGTRHGSPAVLPIRSGAMHQDGYRFFESRNGIWLTERVPVGYIVFSETIFA